MATHRFAKFAKLASAYSGHPVGFLSALFIVIVWALTGPLFKFNDTWQLVINTGTTIITFLMVFLIQNSQNRDTAALQVKIDAILRATKGASDELLDLEDLEQEELEGQRKEFVSIAKKARNELDAADQPSHG